MSEHAFDAWLRRWRLSDAEALLEATRSSTDLERQTGPVPDLAAAAAVVDRYLAGVDAGTATIWAIATGPADTAVGAVGVSSIEHVHRTGWCWYWIAARWRGRGWTTAALLSAVDQAFEAGLFRLELGHRVDNPASRGVATRAGFTSEGVERQKLEYDGIRYDCETHARLVTDRRPTLDGLPIRLG